jgi:hypothetical protein
LGRQLLDSGVDSVTVCDDGCDKVTCEFGRRWITLELAEMTLEDGCRRALSEVGLEDRREREAASRSL